MWYLLGSTVPMVIGLIRSPIYTRIFTPEEYGYYSLIFISFNYLSIVFFSWLASCMWRYYNYFKNSHSLHRLYSAVFSLFFLSSLLLGIIAAIWYSQVDNIFLKKLILLSYLYFLTNESLSILFIRIRIEGKAKLYNLLNSLKVGAAFLLLLWMTFVLNYRIDAFLSSLFYINTVFLLILFVLNIKKLSLSFFKINFSDINLLLRFGLVGIVSNISILILTTSDRFLIKLFDSVDHVGIYNQIYNLGQISVGALVNVFLAAINPSILSEYEHNLEGSNPLTNHYIQMFVYMFLPLTVYLSLFSKQISTVLLGEEFRVGYMMIPYVMISSFLYGLTLFNENKLKFANSLNRIVIIFLASGLINIVLNLLLIPRFGYQVAAATTLIAYFFLYIGFYFSDSNTYFKERDIQRLLLKIVPIIIFQCMIDLFLRKIIHQEIGVILSMTEVLFFLITYILLTRKLRTTLFEK